jgi:hypothetical protein
MLAIILTAGGLLAAGVALVLVSENFAYGVSRVVEAAFESIEVRLDRRERARFAAERSAAESDQIAAGQVVVLKARAAGVTGPLRITGPLRAA